MAKAKSIKRGKTDKAYRRFVRNEMKLYIKYADVYRSLGIKPIEYKL